MKPYQVEGKHWPHGKPLVRCADCLAEFSFVESDNPVAALIAHRAKAHGPPSQTGERKPVKPAPRYRAP